MQCGGSEQGPHRADGAHGGLGVLGWLKVWVASLSIGDQDAEVRGAHWSRSVCKKSLSRGASTGGFTGFV